MRLLDELMGLGRGLEHIGLLRGAGWGPRRGLKGAKALCWAQHPFPPRRDPARSVQLLLVFRSHDSLNAWFKSAGLPWWPLVTHPATASYCRFFDESPGVPPIARGTHIGSAQSSFFLIMPVPLPGGCAVCWNGKACHPVPLGALGCTFFTPLH